MSRTVSIGTAWTEAAAFMRHERRLIAPLVLALIVVPGTISALITPTFPIGTFPQPGGWMAVVAVCVLISLVAQLAIMRLAMGWDGSVGQALGLAVRRIGPVMVALLLFALLYSLAAIPFLLIGGLAGGGGERGATLLASLVVAAALATIPRIVPLTALAMEEATGPWRLLRRSFALTRGRYWPLLGFFIIYLFIGRLLGTVVTVTFGSAAALFVGPPDPMTVSRLMIALPLGIAQGLVAGLFAAMMGRITLQLLGRSSSGM